jgi:hypothetical protein
MFLTVFVPAKWPEWVIGLALVALTPLPLVLPSGIALAAIALTGIMLLLVRPPRQHSRPAPLAPLDISRPARHVHPGTGHSE